MEHTRKLHTWGGFLLLLVLLVTFLIWNLLAGSVRLPASEIWAVLHGGGDLTQRRILLNIRLPRLLAAMILGGALSVSGFLLQTFFHNPIAGPFVLGISSGAKFTVAVTMILLLSRGVTSSSAALIAAAFVGAMLSMGFVLLISRRVRRMSLLVVCGVMIGFICGFVGAGGGFISVPLMVYCNVPMKKAVGTSAALGFPIAVFGSIGYIWSGLGIAGLPGLPVTAGFIHLPALFLCACASFLIAPLGAKVAHSINTKPLKRIFACNLFIIAAYMLYRSYIAF